MFFKISDVPGKVASFVKHKMLPGSTVPATTVATTTTITTESTAATQPVTHQESTTRTTTSSKSSEVQSSSALTTDLTTTTSAATTTNATSSIRKLEKYEVRVNNLEIFLYLENPTGLMFWLNRISPSLLDYKKTDVTREDCEAVKKNFNEFPLQYKSNAKQGKFEKLLINNDKNEIVINAKDMNSNVMIHIQTAQSFTPEIMKSLFKTLFNAELHVDNFSALNTKAQIENSIENTTQAVNSTQTVNQSYGEWAADLAKKAKDFISSNGVTTASLAANALNFWNNPALTFAMAHNGAAALGLYTMYQKLSQPQIQKVEPEVVKKPSIPSVEPEVTTGVSRSPEVPAKLSITTNKPTSTDTPLCSPIKNLRPNYASPVLEPHGLAANPLNELKPQSSPFADLTAPLPATTVPLVKTPSVGPDLSQQRKDFDKAIKDLKVIVNRLESQKKTNIKYKEVFGVAEKLRKELKESGKKFFNNSSPSLESLIAFKSECNGFISTAEVEFKKHRGVWDNIHPKLKMILGILAAIIFPVAIGVSLTSSRGYVGTFFKPSPTQTEQEFNNVKTDIENVEENIHTILRA